MKLHNNQGLEGETSVAGRQLRGRAAKSAGGDFCGNGSILSRGLFVFQPREVSSSSGMNLAICQQTGTSLHLVNCATNAGEPWRSLPQFSAVRLTRLRLGDWSSLERWGGTPGCSWGAAKWVGDLRWASLSLSHSRVCLLLWVAFVCTWWYT